MKTILDKATREELISRVNKLDANSAAQWGKMDAYQMLTHLTIWDEKVLNNVKNKHALIGKLFGKIALRKVLRDEKPIDKNVPTSPGYKSNGSGDIEEAKAKWIAQFQRYEHHTTPEYLHDFFGKMSREQVGQLGYKHIDHHLRQFGR
ncbi:MAG TPA: DUF1569 domain-containing protein [Candidatus Kapabacteria bacterium]|nr:DUF1569 domain-containing protein [Candidatus Kapabacteria bacterium]